MLTTALFAVQPDLLNSASQHSSHPNLFLPSPHSPPSSYAFFFFNDPAPPEISPLSLHDALPILRAVVQRRVDVGEWVDRHAVLERAGTRERPGVPLERARDDLHQPDRRVPGQPVLVRAVQDRKSTRLNSSHANISYAVFCLKKKK